ncbi:hypothetical protein BOX15_Mlig024282g1 [Macrostomum lignano]|uniref:Uncharacterized protein n=1 Tax=Macrostomum lignano TaxID=282301 RepID=A0A267F6T4_9PLAT|nr:hypothetical protein BOX15_Mlig024282g1 [Macrostomum lignano]
MPANNEAASSPSPTDAKPNDSSMSNTSESSSSLKSADRRSSSGGGSEATITKETVSSSEDQTETRAAAEVKENESSSPVGGKIRQSSSDNRIGNDGSQQSANGESRAEQEAVGSQAQQKPNFEQESRGGGSSAFSSSVSLRSGARPLVYMYSPPKRSGQLDGAATKSNKTVSVSGKSPGRRARQAQVAPQASKAGQQQKQQKAVATHQQRPLSQQRKLKQTEDQRSSAHGEDAAANREKKTRAQSARFSSRNKSGRSRGSSSSSSSSSTRKSDRRSKNRSHSRSGRTRRSAERSNREQTVEGREAKAYAHQLKQARAELLTARSRALKTLTVKHRRESRGLPQCLRYPKLLTADTYSASYIYSDTRIIDANLKKDRGDRYQPVFRGTSGALVDPWDDLALAKPARRVKRNNHHHPRPSQSRQSRGHRGANSPLGDRREASASSRGRQQQREAAASRQGDREYTRQSGKKPTEYSREPVFFNQLPEIRSRIKASRSARASRRRDVDYASAADECRRCLDSRQDSRRQKSAADGRQSRRSMAMSCSAYLSATPGSRAAVHDCIRRDDDRQAAGRPASDADEHENQSDNEAAQDNKSDRSSVSSARSSNTGRSSPSSSNQSDRRIENESD